MLSNSTKHPQKAIVPGIRSASTSNSTKHPQKAIVPGIRSASAYELCALPPELFGRVAKFLAVKPDNSEVMRLLIALGPQPKDAAPVFPTIKQWYLEDNARYLEEYLYPIVDPDAEDDIQISIDVIAKNFQSWIDFNPGWKDALLDPYDETNVLTKQIFRNNWRSEKKHSNFEFLHKRTSGCYYSLVDAINKTAPEDKHTVFREPWFEGDIIASIDGTIVLGKSFWDVHGMMEDSGHVRVMRKWFQFFFLNMSVACDLGNYEIFRFIVEDVGAVLSRDDAVGLRFRNLRFYSSAPIMAHAIAQPDPRFFEYLMKADFINPNGYFFYDKEVDESEDLDTLLHMLGTPNPVFEEIFNAIDTSVFLERLETLLRHSRVDVDVRNDEEGVGYTPLENIFWGVHKRDPNARWGEGNRCGNYSKIDLRIAKAFLDAGASTDFLDLDQLPDRRNARKMKALIEAEDKAARDAVISSLDSLKRKRK